MKFALARLACSLAIALPIAPGSAVAADPAAATDAAQVQKLRERIRTDHKGLVRENLPLTQTEAKAFWPVFDRCHEKLDLAQRRFNRTILDYVEGESVMTNARATRIAKELLAAEADEAKALRACYDGAARVLPGTKALRFLHVENKIRALDRFDAAAVIPLVP